MKEKLVLLKNNKGFIKYFRNTSWVLAEKVFRMFVGMFVAVWVARYLGPSQFGLLSYAISFVGLFTSISTLGLDNIIVRELVVNEEKRDLFIGTAFLLKFLGAILVLIMLYIAIQFTTIGKFTQTLIFIIASSCVFQSFNVIDFHFQSKVLSKYIVFANSIVFLISSILKVVLIFVNAPLVYFAIIILVDSFFLAIAYLFFYDKNHLSFIDWKFNKAIAYSLLKDSWPLILSGLVVSLYMKIDQVMIKEMLGDNSVGQYSAAVKLSEAFYFIPVVISASVFPAILNAKKNNTSLYNSRLQKLFDMMVWTGVCIALPMSFLSNWIINLLYGEAYSESGEVLMIHIWTGVFVFLGVSSSKWFVSENLQKYTFYRTLSGAIINIILNLLLIPVLSIYGAALASLISQFVASYLFNFLNIKTIKIFKMQTNAFFLPLRKLGFKYE